MLGLFKKKLAPVQAPDSSRFREMTTGSDGRTGIDLQQLLEQQFDNRVAITTDGKTQDAATYGGDPDFKPFFGDTVPYAQLAWYLSQRNIGWYVSSIMMQNWLIDKCCYMPARDAVRNGWDYKVEESDNADEVRGILEKIDKERKTIAKLIEAVHFARGLGGQAVLFNIADRDPLFYESPFNIDDVDAGEYLGMTLVDPEYITPQFDERSIQDPTHPRFHKPTYYMIGGRKYHYSHLHIITPYPVVNRLKSQYNYFGKSLPQLIFERVYAAERTANEAPLLAATKRLLVLLTDSIDALSSRSARDRIRNLVEHRDNQGVYVGDKTGESVSQLDTSLADLDTVIMTQYQLVSSISGVPSTKLLGTQPKGFNATGEHEAENYRQELESIQTHELTPILDRHAKLCLKSMGIAGDVTVAWRPLDAPTAEQWAAINKTKAETDNIYVQIGAIDGLDVRERLTADEDGDYHNLASVEDGEENPTSAI